MTVNNDKSDKSNCISVKILLKHMDLLIQKKNVIDDISFDIGHGTVLGFLGPNGAGKTTTIKISNWAFTTY